MARRATAIEKQREQGTVLLLDSGESLFRGDYWRTSPDTGQGALLVEAMNMMGYDAMAFGARDLDAPISTVQARLEDAQFAFLSANVKASGVLPNVQSTLLREIEGHTVGIIGITSEQAEKRFQELGLDLTVEDPIAAVGQAVKKIRKRADIIILLSTLNQSQAEELAEAVPDIDAIVGTYHGVQHTALAIPGVENEVVLHGSGMQGEYLGVLQLHFDAQGRVTEFEGRAMPLTDYYEDDPQMVELYRRYASQQ